MTRVIVVGAGGSGLPLAARLAEAGDEVHLVEAGPDPREVADPVLRAGLGDAWTVRAGLPGGALTWTYAADLLDGSRPWRIARGRVLGGSTAVNGAYFQRPAPADFAAWERRAGPEWSYAACVPALRHLESDRDYGASALHGADGPVPVQRADAAEPLTAAFLEAAVAAGAPWQPDKNDGGASGAGPLPRNALGAERWGTWRSYAPLIADHDVRVHVGAVVTRVVIERGRAVGVEGRGQRDEHWRLDGDEVILCGGAIETPRLLFASGIGDAAALAARGITVVADAPAVGRHLSDHAAIDLSWRPRPGLVSPDPVAAWTATWDFDLVTDAAASAARQYGAEVLLAVQPAGTVVGGAAGAEGDIDLRVTMTTPASRGAIDLGGDPVIRYGYLSDPADAGALAQAVRAASALLHSPAMSGVVEAAEVPGDDIDEWVRGRLTTSLHSCGTARMGEVADSHGRVFGVEGLRIADGSMLPAVPSRGTALSAVMIGERIAELIVAERAIRR